MVRAKRSASATPIAAMEEWPKSWASSRGDEVLGRELVRVLRPFVIALQQQGLSSRTLRRHVDGVWLIGGEIVRRVNDEPTSSHQSARALLLEAVEGGEALLVSGLVEEEQEAVDATARKLRRFLSSSGANVHAKCDDQG